MGPLTFDHFVFLHPAPRVFCLLTSASIAVPNFSVVSAVTLICLFVFRSPFACLQSHFQTPRHSFRCSFRTVVEALHTPQRVRHEPRRQNLNPKSSSNVILLHRGRPSAGSLLLEHTTLGWPSYSTPRAPIPRPSQYTLPRTNHVNTG